MNKKLRPMTYLEYFLRHISVSAWLCFMYYTILFVGIPGLTVLVSKAVYFIGNQVVWLALSLVTPAKQRNKYNAFFNVALAYIPYFIITYSPVYKHFTNAFIIATVILSVLYSAAVLCKKIKQKQNAKRIIKRRTQFAFNGVRTIAGFLACILLGTFYLCSVFGIKLVKSDVPILKSANVEEAEQWTIKNNIETIKLLQEEDWRNLSVEEKMDVLSVVRNIEVSYLGLSYEVYLTVKPTDDIVLGYYDHKERTIVLSHELISSGKAKDCLHTLCHEMYHAYQNNQVEVYNTVDEQYKNMAMFAAARVYEEEFTDYISGEDDYFGYLLQDTERTADQYALEAVKDYYNKIDIYLNKERQANEA